MDPGRRLPLRDSAPAPEAGRLSAPNPSSVRSTALEAALFILVAGTAAHLLYGSLGFNPTDEGYLLSASRRLLDGRVPHRDFISLRPVGTPLLHAHLLLWTGERLIWWSRYVAWLQLAAVGWMWATIVAGAFGVWRGFLQRAAVALVGLAVAAHWFPVMPWNTLDAVFFLTLATLARAGGSHERVFLPSVGAGMTVMFRQNFAFALIAWLVVLGGWRKWRAWAGLCLPGALYVAVLLFSGAWGDAVAQLTSHRLHSAQTLGFLLDRAFWAGAGIGVVWLLLARVGRLSTAARWSALAVVGIAIVVGTGLPRTPIALMSTWVPFGIVSVWLPIMLMDGGGRGSAVFQSLLLAWASSVSEGWPRAGLGGCGIAAVLAVLLWYPEAGKVGSRGRGWRTGIAVLALAVVLIDFHVERRTHIYYDRPAPQLTYDVGDVLRGGRDIKTNADTYDFLAHLNGAVEWTRSHGRTVVVLHELAQFWVTYPQANPLSTDWAGWAELAAPALQERIRREVESLAGKAAFIVQKRSAYELAWRVQGPPEWNRSFASGLVRSRFLKVFENRWFEIYE